MGGTVWLAADDPQLFSISDEVDAWGSGNLNVVLNPTAIQQHSPNRCAGQTLTKSSFNYQIINYKGLRLRLVTV